MFLAAQSNMKASLLSSIALTVLFATACTSQATTITVQPPTSLPTIAATPGPGTANAGGALFIFTETGGLAGQCDHVEVYSDGAAVYQAGCRGAGTKGSASADALKQLQQLADRLAAVNQTVGGEPGQPDATRITLVLSGTGTAEPTDEDVRRMVDIGREIVADMRG